MSELNNSVSATTLRSLVVGTVLCAAIGTGAAYGSNVIGGSMLAAKKGHSSGSRASTVARMAYDFPERAVVAVK